MGCDQQSNSGSIALAVRSAVSTIVYEPRHGDLELWNGNLCSLPILPFLT